MKQREVIVKYKNGSKQIINYSIINKIFDRLT